ncbi:Four-domain proteases inhibitor-like protein, partial [Globisporangium splendens]
MQDPCSEHWFGLPGHRSPTAAICFDGRNSTYDTPSSSNSLIGASTVSCSSSSSSSGGVLSQAVENSECALPCSGHRIFSLERSRVTERYDIAWTTQFLGVTSVAHVIFGLSDGCSCISCETMLKFRRNGLSSVSTWLMLVRRRLHFLCLQIAPQSAHLVDPSLSIVVNALPSSIASLQDKAMQIPSGFLVFLAAVVALQGVLGDYPKESGVDMLMGSADCVACVQAGSSSSSSSDEDGDDEGSDESEEDSEGNEGEENGDASSHDLDEGSSDGSGEHSDGSGRPTGLEWPVFPWGPAPGTDGYDACAFVCPMFYAPVCTEDGHIYENKCVYASARCRDSTLAEASANNCPK